VPLSSWKPNDPQDKPAGFSVKLVAFSEKCLKFESFAKVSSKALVAVFGPVLPTASALSLTNLALSN